MTVLGKDTAVRANQSGWGTASDGQTWSHARGSSNWNVASNELTVDTNSGFYNVFTLGSTTPKDAELLVRYTPGASGDSGGLTIRHIDLNNFYYCDIGNLGQFAEIGKDVATTFTSIKSVAFTWTAGTAYWMRFQVVGTNLALKVWQDGTAEPNTWTVQTTDSSLSSAGAYGIACDPIGATAMKYDSFYAVDYANCENLSASDSSLSTDTFIPVDALSAADMPSSLQAWNVDALTTTDNVLFADSFVPAESLTVSDTLLSTDSALFVEANSASDSFSNQIGYVPVESLSTSDSILVSDGYVPIDLLSATDMQSSLQAWNIDALSTADSVLFVDSFLPVDALSVSNGILSTDNTVLVEAGSVNDVFSGQSGYVISDNLTATDSLLTQDNYTPSDGLSTSDNLLIQNGYSATDGLSVLDTLLSQGGAIWIEINTTSDSFSVGGSYLPIEGLFISDSLLNGDGYTASDLLSISDMPSALQSWGIDALNASDSFSSGATFLPFEALSIIDKLLVIDQASWSDLLSVNDNFSGASSPPSVVSVIAVTWVTRDGTVTWKTRDNTVTWLTRDNNVTWRSRG